MHDLQLHLYSQILCSYLSSYSYSQLVLVLETSLGVMHERVPLGICGLWSSCGSGWLRHGLDLSIVGEAIEQ